MMIGAAGDRRRRRPLVGRDRELAVLRRLIGSASAGDGGALLVHGGAGIGKTALVTTALTTTDSRVLWATGSQYEQDLPFAGLHQLLVPLLDRRDGWRSVQDRVLATALGLAEPGASPTIPLIAEATLDMLTDRAQETPILAAVDDAQWLDDASAQVIAHVAHHLSGTAVALMVAVREPATVPSLAGLPELAVPALREADARTVLLSGLGAPLDPLVRDRILDEARGNPLALLELPPLAGGFGVTPGGDGLPVTLRERFRERHAGLPPAARRFLVVAAADPTGDAAVVRRAARALGVDPAAEAEAAGSGLIEVGTRLRFGHPLMRSAVYETVSPADRVAAHRALADATDPATDPDRRAWHAAQAASGPDAELAADLERLSTRAHARGGLAAAAAFLERAAVLTADPLDRARRLLTAGTLRRETGELTAALDLATVAEHTTPDPVRHADAAVLRARVAFDQGRDENAVRRLLDAARQAAPIDPALARGVLFDALAALIFMGSFADSGLLAEVAAQAAALPAADYPPRPAELLLEGMLARVRETPRAGGLAWTREGGPPDPALLGRAVATYVRHSHDGSAGSGIGELWLACSAAQDLWDDGAFLKLARRQLDQARRTGAVTAMPVALSYRGLAAVFEGRFTEAQQFVDEAYVAAADVGAPAMTHVDLCVAAWRGDEQRTERLSREVTRDALARGEGRLLTAVACSRAVLLNGQGRYRETVEVCRASPDLDEPSYPLAIFPEFVEAASRTGDLDAATRVVVRLEQRAAELDSDWCTGTAEGARALVTSGPAADAHYRKAIEHLGRTAGRVRLARARLLHGEWLRRNGRRSHAAAQLRVAHDAFAEMGVTAFAARAARELAAVGGRRGSGKHGLTDREQAVARLVAGGATTREVAAELFVSPRTVDTHLRGVFAKLGITSRRELRGRLSEHGPDGRTSVPSSRS